MWDLLIVGNNSTGIQIELEGLASDLGIHKRVHFLGLRTDIADILSLADVSLLTSHQEGFSNAVLDGMAADLPMILTDVGGNAEAVLDGETGIVVPPHDPVSLAEAIDRMLSNLPSVIRWVIMAKIDCGLFF